MVDAARRFDKGRTKRPPTAYNQAKAPRQPAGRERRRMFGMNIDDLSPELRERAKACKTADELIALAESEGAKSRTRL